MAKSIVFIGASALFFHLHSSMAFAAGHFSILTGPASHISCGGDAPVICRIPLRELRAEEMPRCLGEDGTAFQPWDAVFDAQTEQGEILLDLLVTAVEHKLMIRVTVENGLCRLDPIAATIHAVEIFRPKLAENQH